MIKLLYWRPYKDSFTNYGDELSPYIISKLSGCTIQQKDPYIQKLRKRWLHAIKLIITGKWSFFMRLLRARENNILAIGSILRFGNKVSKIWGSGFMCKEEQCIGGYIYALRGTLSLDLAKQQNLNFMSQIAIGDPALLLPLVLPLKKTYNFKFGLIPHYSEYEELKSLLGDKIKLIKLQDGDVESITKEILSCQYIISTSLHGLIVAHAYGIPALWFENSRLELNTHGFKFYDYFSSVGIESYVPFRNFDYILNSQELLNKIFEENMEKSLPSYDVRYIQKELLRNAPFDIKKEFLI